MTMLRWFVRTTALSLGSFDEYVDAFIGPEGVLQPLRQGRNLAVRALVGRRDLRANLSGKRRPNLARLRTAVDSSPDGFVLGFWYSPATADPFWNDPDLSQVGVFVGPHHAPGHCMITFAGRAADAEPTLDVFVEMARRWGVDFGGAWFDGSAVGPYCPPEVEGKLSHAGFSTDTLGPTWLTALRPSVAARLDAAWRAEHGFDPRIVRVPGPEGLHEIWQLSEEPGDLDSAVAQRWSGALGASLPGASP